LPRVTEPARKGWRIDSVLFPPAGRDRFFGGRTGSANPGGARARPVLRRPRGRSGASIRGRSFPAHRQSAPRGTLCPGHAVTRDLREPKISGAHASVESWLERCAKPDVAETVRASGRL